MKPLDSAHATLNDPDGLRVPEGLEVIDAHVHLFPNRVFEAVWRWFDKHAWKIRYRLTAEQVVEFLTNKGVRSIVALQYSHVPGMASELNAFMGEMAKAYPQLVPLATVLPGEPDAGKILHEAFTRHGLQGVKIHCHVQKLAPDDPRLEEVFEACQEARVPLVMHAGKEPSIDAYGVDTRALCGAEAVRPILQQHPKLTLVVPHMGADEFDAYAQLLSEFENLYLDSTMAFAEYFDSAPSPDLLTRHAGRIMYGSDFPNIPYAWDRELKRLARLVPDPLVRNSLFHSTARKVFGIA